MKKLLIVFSLFVFAASLQAGENDRVVLENKSKLGFEETVNYIKTT